MALAYPEMFRVAQTFPRTRVEDISATVEAELARLDLTSRIKPGQSVAVTAGSRGIANIAEIVRAIVAHLKSIDAAPFIVPAMGSHGGGTAEAQRAIVEEYGMTEDYVGCPIRATMDTVVICETPEGIPVHFDRFAYEADHVFVANRVKPHTNFVGDVESGLMKMMLIGLGKHAGAAIYHRAIHDYSFGQIVRSVAHRVLDACNIVGGLGIVENGYDETARIEAVPPEQFESREIELLKLAKEWMPRLPFEHVDVLILDEIGKNISGSGLDTNVVGRKYLDHRAADHEFPKIKMIWVRDLTDATRGNAAGVGLAEFCTRRVVDKLDRKKTQINCLTGGHPVGAMIPVVFDTDREVLDATLQNNGLTPPEDARILRIKNTLQLAEVECSAAYWDDAQSRDDLEVLVPRRPLSFDAEGNLPTFAATAQAHAANTP